MTKHFIYTAIIVVLAGLAGWLTVQLPTRQGLDVRGGMRITLRPEIEKLTPKEQREWNPERLNIVAETLRRRLDAFGVSERYIFTKGDREIVIELPGFTDEQEARDLLQTTARLEFRYLKDIEVRNEQKQKPGRYQLVFDKNEAGEEVVRFRDLGDPKEPGRLIKEGTPEYLQIIQNSPLIISGDELVDAEVTRQAFSPAVVLYLNPEAQNKFARATSLYLYEHIAIVLDDRIISAPVVQAPNIREPIIEGNFTLKEATRLRNLLRAGALPVSLSIESINRVEPILGERAWERILQAGAIGVIAVMAFMVFYYLLPGIIAVIALALYILFAIALFKMVGVTFSLPAIAGFILSTGMAVDANILIFERVKEELRLGKTLLSAIDAGFKRAFPAIFDSNLSTIITCLILYYYGTGPVQGFATTLAIGITMSFFTAIFCTRTMLYLLVGLGVHPDPKWFGLFRQIGVEVSPDMARSRDRFDFVSRRGLYYAGSAALIAVGLVFWLGLGGLKPGIDFAGGSEIVLQKAPPQQSTRMSQSPELAQATQPLAPIQAPKEGDTATQQPSGTAPTASPSAPATSASPAESSASQPSAAPTAGETKPQPTAPAQTPSASKPQAYEPEPIEADINQVVALLRKAGFEKVGVQFAEGKRQLIIHVADTTEKDKARILEALKPLGDLKDVSFATISPRVRAETVQRAYTAVILSLIAILLYIAIRFSIEGGWSGFKFGLAAIIALAHDVLFTVGALAVFGYFFGWEVNALFLTALLTLIGFSINDTIVVYDRIRENLRYRVRGETLAQIVNRSLNQTLARSVNTSLTLVLVLIALLLFGSVTHDLRTFYVAMTIGVIAGTYSSIFIASQIMVSWQGTQERLRERQLRASQATATTPSPTTNAGTPTPTSTAPTSSGGKKKHRAAHVGKRKRRY